MCRILLVVALVLLFVPAFAQNEVPAGSVSRSRTKIETLQPSLRFRSKSIEGRKVFIDYNRIYLTGAARREFVQHILTDVLAELGGVEVMTPDAAEVFLTGAVADMLQRQDREGASGRTVLPNLLTRLPGDVGKFFRRNTPSEVFVGGSSGHDKWSFAASVDLKFVGRSSQVLLNLRGSASKQSVARSDKELSLAFGRFFSASDLRIYQASDQDAGYIALASVSLALLNASERDTPVLRARTRGFPVEIVGFKIFTIKVDDATADRLEVGQDLPVMFKGGKIGTGRIDYVSGSGNVTLKLTDYSGPAFEKGQTPLEVEVPR